MSGVCSREYHRGGARLVVSGDAFTKLVYSVVLLDSGLRFTATLSRIEV